jgi:hypothetical protein
MEHCFFLGKIIVSFNGKTNPGDWRKNQLGGILQVWLQRQCLDDYG